MSFLAESRSNNELIEPRVSFHDIPLSAIRQKSREKLSLLLNPTKVLNTEDGYQRDWRGLFTLSGMSQSENTLISQSQDKTGKLLELWIKRSKDNGSVVTVSQLQDSLGIIDRYDVYDDTVVQFTEDAKAFLSKPSRRDTDNSGSYEVVKADPDNDIITMQDLECSEKGLPLKTYDAFVIYNDKDVEFASELIERCEQMGYSLCTKDRDLLGGLSFESDAILNLLSQRCNRLIVIVSKAFLKSPMQIFITNFAQALGIEQGKRKIVPCLLEPCDLPQMLRFCFRLDYFRSNKLFDFWDKLDKSLRVTTELKSSNLAITDRSRIPETDVTSNNLRVSMPTTPGPLYDKEQVYKFTETPTPTPDEKTKKFLYNKTSSHEETKQIWPQPKLRAASSMLALNNIPNGDTGKARNKLSQSTFHLNQETDAGLEAIKMKRKKWYKMFLPPSGKSLKSPKENTLAELPEIKLDKDKRPWYKPKKKKSKQKSAIALEA